MDHKALYPRISARGSGQFSSGDTHLTEEERKLRNKLEEEVERGLEDEIKDGIYRLALRLGRLYESQNKRIMRPKQGSLSEVNICIKMDGGTRVEIREAKKEAQFRTETPRRVAGERRGTDGSATRLDWAKSLRSRGATPLPPRLPDVVKKREPFRFR